VKNRTIASMVLTSLSLPAGNRADGSSIASPLVNVKNLSDQRHLQLRGAGLQKIGISTIIGAWLLEVPVVVTHPLGVVDGAQVVGLCPAGVREALRLLSGGRLDAVAPAKIIEEVEQLVDGWCDRRSLRALREILSGWPLSSGLTDDWGNLLDALEKVRAFARDELTENEARVVEDLIHDVQRVILQT
jgi:hypothetical protein